MDFWDAVRSVRFSVVLAVFGFTFGFFLFQPGAERIALPAFTLLISFFIWNYFRGLAQRLFRNSEFAFVVVWGPLVLFVGGAVFGGVVGFQDWSSRERHQAIQTRQREGDQDKQREREVERQRIEIKRSQSEWLARGVKALQPYGFFSRLDPTDYREFPKGIWEMVGEDVEALFKQEDGVDRLRLLMLCDRSRVWRGDEYFADAKEDQRPFSRLLLELASITPRAFDPTLILEEWSARNADASGISNETVTLRFSFAGRDHSIEHPRIRDGKQRSILPILGKINKLLVGAKRDGKYFKARLEGSQAAVFFLASRERDELQYRFKMAFDDIKSTDD